MKKDVTYSMRLNRHTRLLLQQAAQHERRSIASLIDKIITDYLKNEGYLKRSDRIEDQRSGCRKTTMLPAIAMQGPATGHTESFACFVHDISNGGVLLGFPKGSNFNISSRGELPHFKLSFPIPEMRNPLEFNCAARHMRDTGAEIQVGCTFESSYPEGQLALQKYLA